MAKRTNWLTWGLVGLIVMPVMCSECQGIMMERRCGPAETRLMNRVYQAHLIGATPAQVERWLHRQGVVYGYSCSRVP